MSRWARGKLDAKVAIIDKDLESALKDVLQRFVEDVGQMPQLCEVQLAKNLKRLVSSFHLEGGKVSNAMKRASDDCNVGTHRKVANCVARL